MASCKILIVDDDPDDRDILKDTFGQIGVSEVHTVASAQQAITFLQEVDADEALPKLIITDLNMPGISGFELLQALKGMRRYQSIPIIVCSTTSSRAQIDKCLDLGASDYMTKPSALMEYVELTEKMRKQVVFS